MSEPTIGVSITAAPIQFHHPPGDDRGVHMLRLGATSFLHISPEVAAQWLPVIATIAEDA